MIKLNKSGLTLPTDMNREDRRKAGITGKVPTYNFTLEQLKAHVQAEVSAEVEKIREQARDEAVELALTLMLALPMEVLIGDGYWKKTAKKRIPKFHEDLLSLYDSWAKGIVTLEELRADLWEYGGIKLVAPKGTEKF
jgi:hypothetical protein